MVYLLPGDIFLNDSDKKGPRIVKFFMTAPTWIHHLWRKFTGTQEKVNFYHPGIVSADTDKVLEQQKSVQYSDANKVIFNRRHIVYRPKYLSLSKRYELVKVAESELGQGWGVVHALGRFATWLTGIKLFARYISMPTREVSAGRVARWYYKAFGETFGEKHYRYVTTHTIDKWCKNHSEDWETISYKGE